MPQIRVDFYLVKDSTPPNLGLFACRFIEKAYRRRHRVFVLCKNKFDAEFLDELLWTFKAESFIPHNLQGEGPEPPPPIQIGFGKEPRGFNDILMNLTDEVPSFFNRFNRIIELVAENEAAKAISRQQFRFYQKNGCTLYTHEVQAQSSP